MARIDFITAVHTSTRRDYLGRVNEWPKAECATVAKRFDRDYWDGERRYGYGGYRYDGRWRPVAERIAEHYGLQAGQRVLDVGCGMGHLLYELTQAVPGLSVAGLDLSEYAVAHAKEEIRPFVQVGHARSLPFDTASVDLVLSINTLHNLYVYDLFSALGELMRVSRRHQYLTVESYRTEAEKVNLLYWQLTCECFFTPDEWAWVYQQSGYTGDYGYIFFE